jgi:hypothetical protein
VAFFDHMLEQARERGLLSHAYVTVDGALIAAWASQQRVTRQEAKPPSPPDDPSHPRIDCRRERRQRPACRDDCSWACLDKQVKGPEAKRCDLGYGLMEHRPGLVVATRVTQATDTAERDAAVATADAIPGQHRATLGADHCDDTRDCARERWVTPAVAQHTTGRASATAGRTTRHPGDAVSQRQRKGVEEVFGWLQTVGLRRKTWHRGVARGGVDVHRGRGGVQRGPYADPGSGRMNERGNAAARHSLPPAHGPVLQGWTWPAAAIRLSDMHPKFWLSPFLSLTQCFSAAC